MTLPTPPPDVLDWLMRALWAGVGAAAHWLWTKFTNKKGTP